MSHDSPLIAEPFALRPREAAKYAGVCLTEVYARLRDKTYEGYTDGGKRFVTLESIKRHQQKQFEASRSSTKPARELKAGPGRPKAET